MAQQGGRNCPRVALMALLFLTFAVLTSAGKGALKGPATIYWSIRQAQQMCDMPLPRGHENDGAPLVPKAMVQGTVDARALHLCQQWNFVVAQMQANGKMVGYKIKPIISAEKFHDVKAYAAEVEASRKGGPVLAGAYPAVEQAIAQQGYMGPSDEHYDLVEGVHGDAASNFQGG
eukprot:CAMPEP_0197608168 /NCGR_PEP_ID=MMETSP1326-20131121/48526_1 /TAXON_ID=1155430 /ORGANISM="Genus nov. species nov., Strain RCC2288" /LENGTH=174 /DNA_ID=CAMNT_0043176335 /DNA_START=66 /DNA_END=586 /DNA_ORIENTATION=+